MHSCWSGCWYDFDLVPQPTFPLMFVSTVLFGLQYEVSGQLTSGLNQVLEGKGLCNMLY